MLMSRLTLYIVIVLVFAAAFVATVVLAYNRRLDRIARGEERDTHSSVPEPRTAVGVVYRTVLMGIVLVSLFTVSAVSGKLSSLQNTVNYLQSNQSSLRWEISELRQQLEERDKLVSSSDWELRDPEPEGHTAQVSFSVTLRQYSEDTAVELALNGRTVPLARQEAGRFTAEFPVDIFEDYEAPRILISEGGKTVTEDADFPQSFFWDLLPMPMFECRFESDSALGKLKYEGSYKIETSRTEDLESVTVSYLSGGKELKTLDLTEETRSGQWIELEKGLELDKDLTFRIEIVTKSGFRIRDQKLMIYDASADLEDAEFTRILDAEGNLIWEDPYKN